MDRNVITTREQEEQALLPGVAEDAMAGIVGGRRRPTARREPDDYKSRILKYIPAEIVAVYLTLDGIVRSAVDGASRQIWLHLILGFGLVVTPLFLWRVAKVRNKNQLVISTISFAVWVFALGGAFADYSWYKPFEGAIALVMYTFLIPIAVNK
jgi:hypothetical protein